MLPPSRAVSFSCASPCSLCLTGYTTDRLPAVYVPPRHTWDGWSRDGMPSLLHGLHLMKTISMKFDASSPCEPHTTFHSQRRLTLRERPLTCTEYYTTVRLLTPLTLRSVHVGLNAAA